MSKISGFDTESRTIMSKKHGGLKAMDKKFATFSTVVSSYNDDLNNDSPQLQLIQEKTS